MTPHNPKPTVDFTNFGQSYRHHLGRELVQISAWDLIGNLGVAAAGCWLGWLAYQNEDFFGAVAVGVLVLYLAHTTWSVLLQAAEATVAAHPWYGVGRTVHHQLLGACVVLDVDDRDEVAHIWVLIQPLETEGSALWEMACKVTETATDITAGEE